MAAASASTNYDYKYPGLRQMANPPMAPAHLKMENKPPIGQQEQVINLAPNYPLDGPMRPYEIESCLSIIKLYKSRLEHLLSTSAAEGVSSELILQMMEVLHPTSASADVSSDEESEEEEKTKKSKKGKKKEKKERKIQASLGIRDGAKVSYKGREYYFQRRSTGSGLDRCLLYVNLEDLHHPRDAACSPMAHAVRLLQNPQ